jgi:hypothetical protein
MVCPQKLLYFSLTGMLNLLEFEYLFLGQFRSSTRKRFRSFKPPFPERVRSRLWRQPQAMVVPADPTVGAARDCQQSRAVASAINVPSLRPSQLLGGEE